LANLATATYCVLSLFCLVQCFVNLFSEVEPFSAILIAHGSLGGLLRPEGPKFEAKGWEWRKVLGERTARGLGEHCEMPQWGSGRAPTTNTLWTY